MAQCTILTELGRIGAVTLADLSRSLGLDKGWVSRSVEALAQEGLLAKTPSDADKRTVIIDMTGPGQALCQDVNTNLDALSERVIKRIPPREQEGVLKALKLLEQALEAELAAESSGRTCC